MTILPDGRWRLSGPELDGKVWEKVTGWRLEPDGRHMVPNFPTCSFRKLQGTCLPCGKTSGLNYWCEKKRTFVSVSYCKVCADKGENLGPGLQSTTEEVKT